MEKGSRVFMGSCRIGHSISLARAYPWNKRMAFAMEARTRGSTYDAFFRFMDTTYEALDIAREALLYEKSAEAARDKRSAEVASENSSRLDGAIELSRGRWRVHGRGRAGRADFSRVSVFCGAHSAWRRCFIEEEKGRACLPNVNFAASRSPPNS